MNAFDYFFENTSTLEKPFLVGGETITFKELYKSSLSLSYWLNKNIGNNKNVILISVNNLFFLKAYLAIIKSGNICVPLDPNTEKDNFAYIAGLTKPAMVFMTRETHKRLPVDDFRCVLPDSLPEENRTDEVFQNDSTSSENCAEIIFTSGSTGKPKGVMISHKNIIANTASIIDYLNLKADDRMLVGLIVGTLWSAVAMVCFGRKTGMPLFLKPSNACGEVTSWMKWRSI
jgi:long-subunit acyl-CoA synthetase (AMP-forming)